MKFWPGGKKEKAIDYNGDRSVDDMVKFIKDHATFNVEVDGETEEKKDEKKDEKKEEKKEEKKDDKGENKEDL